MDEEQAEEDRKLKFDLSVAEQFVLFSGATDLTLSFHLIAGDSITFTDDAQTGLSVGVKLYHFEHMDDEGITSPIAYELRARTGDITITRGQRVTFPATIGPVDESRDYIMEIGLVREGQYWFTDIGHPRNRFTLRNRLSLVKHDSGQSIHLEDMFMLAKDFRDRERRYEAIIFALLEGKR